MRGLPYLFSNHEMHAQYSFCSKHVNIFLFIVKGIILNLLANLYFMKKNILICLCLSAIISCSSSKQGKVKQGKDGKIENAKIIAKCTPPQKSYAKEIEAKLKATMDSLRFTPNANFDASFSQKIVKLNEYSPMGLDWDLLAFRICEMANNRGFTSEQTSSLLTKALDLWENAHKSSQKQQSTQVAISLNQQGGVTANNVYFSDSKFSLSNSDKQKLEAWLRNKGRKISVLSIMGNNTSLDFANKIVSFLKESGYTQVGNEVGQFMQSPIIFGVRIDTTKYEIRVGYLENVSQG